MLNQPSPSNTRRTVLETLKREGGLSAAEVAARLAISVAGARLQLVHCHNDGLVCSMPRRNGKGRPTLIYTLSEEGQNLFGQRYDRIAIEVLDNAARIGGEELIERIFAERIERIFEKYREAATPSTMDERIRLLAALRDDDGYMAAVELDGQGATTLVEYHCPVAAVARKYPLLCKHEIELLRRILGPNVRVDRVQHRISGDHVCRYRLSCRSNGDGDS